MIGKILKWGVIVVVVIFILSILFGGEEKPKLDDKKPDKKPDCGNGSCDEAETAASCPADCKEDKPKPGEGDAWAKVRADDVAQLSKEWSTPVFLGINKYNGWIDSLHVADDGKTLYYVFYPGADLMADTATGNFKGEADIYMAEFPFEKHTKLDKYFMAKSPYSSCCVQLDAEGAFWYNSNYEGRPGGSAEGDYDWHPLYRNDQLVPLNEKGKDFGDVFYCAAKDELWGVSGGELKRIKNAKANGFKGKPEKAPDTLSSDPGGQPYLTPDCNTLYYSTNLGDTKSQGPVFYKSTRTGEDKWSKPEPFLWGKVGVGEWTMTADGKAFFVQLFKNDKGETRIGAFSTERK